MCTLALVDARLVALSLLDRCDLGLQQAGRHRESLVDRWQRRGRRALLSPRDDAIALVDLRPLGAVVASYAFRVTALLVNGERIALRRPCVAIVDTGTTGLVLSDTLYDSDELPLPGGAFRDAQVEGVTERGVTFTLSASRRRPRSVRAECVWPSRGGTHFNGRWSALSVRAGHFWPSGICLIKCSICSYLRDN